ncbi:hypothetical protein E3P99_02132 [Wallemia hederae]|uniref:Charged multivesicular body protein 5 n=1 Tax=Wallemia hederae TaxID=1540922 RepID=A0A4T0FM66_9BASI|nr:hypothetical protein E3P99_02132 [Wallemia hederae]
MQRLFGYNQSKTPKPSLNDAIKSTESRASSIEAKVKKCDQELAQFKQQMNRLRDGPGKVCLWYSLGYTHTTRQRAVQQRAMRSLQQRKVYESQLEQLQQQTFNMEQAQMTTENLSNTMATVDAMQTANKQMRKQYGKIDIDKIDSIQDDMQDLIESATEVQETLGRSYGVPDEIDEADLEAELDALGDDLHEIDETPSYLQNPDSNPPETIPELLETPQPPATTTPAQANASRGESAVI